MIGYSLSLLCSFLSGETIPDMHPYQSEEDDSDDDQMQMIVSTPIRSQALFNRSQNNSSSLKPKFLPSEVSYSSKMRSNSVAASNVDTKSSSDSEDQRIRSQSDVKTRNMSRKSGLSRKGGMVGIDRQRLQQYRDRTRSPSASGSNSRSTSPSSNAELNVTDRDAAATSFQSGFLPSIKVSTIPSHPPPTFTSQSLPTRSASPESESESWNKTRVIHQMHPTSSTDSTVMVSDDRKQEPVSAIKEKIQDKKPAETRSISSTGSSDRASPVPKKDTSTSEDEFKRMKSPPRKPPPQGDFGMTSRKVGAGHSFDAQGSTDKEDDKFIVAHSFEDEGKSDSKSTDAEEDMFKKVIVSSGDPKPVPQARKKVIDSLHSARPPPSGPSRSYSPSPSGSSPPPPSGPSPRPSPRHHPPRGLPPAQAAMQENEDVESIGGGTPSRGFKGSPLTRKSAVRISRNKRPPPHPNVASKDKEVQPQNEDEVREDFARIRTRSNVITGGRPQGFSRDAAVEDEDGEDIIPQQRPRSRATSQDRHMTSEAAIETSTKSEGEAIGANWKPDGEN